MIQDERDFAFAIALLAVFVAAGFIFGAFV